MHGRPIIVIRLLQFVGWVVFAGGVLLGIRTVSTLTGGPSPFRMMIRGGNGASVDLFFLSFLPAILIVGLGLLIVAAGYGLTMLHDIRDETARGRAEP